MSPISYNISPKNEKDLVAEIEAKYHTTDVQVLSSLMQRIYKKESNVLKRGYPMPIEFTNVYSLVQALGDIKVQGMFPELISTDRIIKQEATQGKDENTRRRINFLTIMIMQMIQMNARDRAIIHAIVRNMNICKCEGKYDSLDGLRSYIELQSNPNRLKGFSEEEKNIIKFAVMQYSETDERNALELERLPVDLRVKYKKYLDVIKDAIRLDDIQIDPIVNDVYRRIDILKLNAKEHKTKLESVAYEAHNKILEVLDIEEEMQQLMSYLKQASLEQHHAIEDIDR